MHLLVTPYYEFMIKMASAPERVEDNSEKLRNLTLSGVKPVANQGLGRGAYGKVYKVRYRGLDCAAKEIHPILFEGVSPQERQSVKDTLSVNVVVAVNSHILTSYTSWEYIIPVASSFLPWSWN